MTIQKRISNTLQGDSEWLQYHDSLNTSKYLYPFTLEITLPLSSHFTISLTGQCSYTRHLIPHLHIFTHHQSTHLSTFTGHGRRCTYAANSPHHRPCAIELPTYRVLAHRCTQFGPAFVDRPLRRQRIKVSPSHKTSASGALETFDHVISAV